MPACGFVSQALLKSLDLAFKFKWNHLLMTDVEDQPEIEKVFLVLYICWSFTYLFCYFKPRSLSWRSGKSCITAFFLFYQKFLIELAGNCAHAEIRFREIETLGASSLGQARH